MTARLGVAWEPVDRHGQADLLGVPQDLLDRFSQRRQQVTNVAERRIAEWEGRLGRRLSGKERARQFQFAAYETRPAKSDRVVDEASLRDGWRADAARWGHAVDAWLAGTLGRARRVPAVDEQALVREVIADLEVSLSTWSRADVAVAVARRLTALPGRAAAVGAAMDRLSQRVLDDREVVRLSVPSGARVPEGLCRGDGDATFERHGARRYSTRHTLTLEGRVLETVRRGRGASAGVAPTTAVAAASVGVEGDQLTALWRLCRGGQRVACLIGPAGTGKTRTVAAAVEAWRSRGVPVRGLAVSAAAAEVLAEQTGAPADTVAKLLYEHDQANADWRLQPGEVVLVDEAGLAPTYQLAALCKMIEEASGKLVLVGDPAQIGSVDAGGLLRLIAADRAVTVELGVARRFAERWEANASLALRRQAAGVLAVYEAHDRIHGGRRDQILDSALERWATTRAGGDSVLLVAGDRATVAELAGRARAMRVAAGEVAAAGVGLDDGVLVGVGDEILTCRNNRQLHTSAERWVRNGDRWKVTARHRDGSLTVASMSAKGQLRLPADYVAEHVTLSYAVTAHRAQGVTVDQSIAVIDERCSAEQLYVAMTRGRHANTALVLCEPAEHHRGVPAPVQVLEGVLSRSGIRLSATEALRQEAAAAEDLAVLHPLLHQAAQHIERHAGRDRSAERDQYRDAAERYGRAVRETGQAREQLEGLCPQHAETARALAEARLELELLQRAAERKHRWQRTPAVDLWPATMRVDALAGEAQDLDDQIERATGRLRRAQGDQERLAPLHAKHHDADAAVHARQRWLESHPVEIAWQKDLSARIAERTDRLGADAVERTPRHLTMLIGSPPTNPAIRQVWQVLAGHLEAYRERWRIPGDQLATHSPSPGVQTKLREQLAEAVRYYNTHWRPSAPARRDDRYHRYGLDPNRATPRRDRGRGIGR